MPESPRKALLIFGSLAFLAGCMAAPPEKIEPTITSRDFSAFNCEALAIEKLRIETALAPLYQRQREIRGDDMVTSIMTLGAVPAHSALTENKIPTEIATLKGEASAVSDQIILHGCRLLPVQMPPPWKPKHPMKYTGGAPVSSKD